MNASDEWDVVMPFISYLSAARIDAEKHVVEAAIPWKLLAGAPKPDAESRIDFGVLFGDPSGMTTVLRAYWSNRDTNIVTDIPSEARLQPGNWGICRFGE